MLDNTKECPQLDCGGYLKLYTDFDDETRDDDEIEVKLKCKTCEVTFRAFIYTTDFEYIDDDVSGQ